MKIIYKNIDNTVAVLVPAQEIIEEAILLNEKAIEENRVSEIKKKQKHSVNKQC